MKSYTDIEQSKKLTEILPLESADMCYKIVAYNPKDTYEYQPYCFSSTLESDIPCWSLAALLDILPDRTCVYKKSCKDGRVKYKGVVKGCKELILKENPIDACVEMILKLHAIKTI